MIRIPTDRVKICCHCRKVISKTARTCPLCGSERLMLISRWRAWGLAAEFAAKEVGALKSAQ